MALGFMRRHRRWFFVLLWVVILGFLGGFVGLLGGFVSYFFPSFQDPSAGSAVEVLGVVGEHTITVGEFQKAYNGQRRMYERIYQGRLTPEVLRSLRLEQQVFEALVEERLVRLEARRLGISVSDEALAREIAKLPGLQENGVFAGAAEVRRRIEAQGGAIQDFEESLRNKLLREGLEALIGDGVGVSAVDVEREFRRRNEQIKAEYVLVDSARFRDGPDAEEAEIRALFDSKREAYRVPEKRVVSFVLIEPEALKARVTVTDHDIELYYQEHRDEFLQPEEVCASHILVKVKQNPADKEGHSEDEARQRAGELLARVKAGADFAEQARKSSEDKGSGAGGGDLGCFARGSMVPEFDNAVFSMSVGETSDLVKSSFGYHVIRVNSRKEEAVPPLTQVKERIRQTVVADRVRVIAEEKVQALGAALKRGQGIEAAAREQGLASQTSAPLARGDSVEPLASPALVARAFELKPGAVDQDGFAVPRGYAFIGLVKSLESHVPEFAEALPKVKEDLLAEKALDKARSRAAELKARAEKDGLEKAAAAVGLVRKETPALVSRGQPIGDLGAGIALDEMAYALPEKTLSEPVRAAAGYAVVRIIEKKAFDPVAFEKQKSALVTSLRSERKGQLFQAYMNQVRQRYPVERRPQAFKRVVGRG